MASGALMRDGGGGLLVKGVYEAAFMSGVPSDWHQ